MKKVLVCFILSILITGCAGSKRYDKDISEIKKMISSRMFQIENNWAQPLRGGQINLIGNDNFITIKKDSLHIFLPYFGVRQFGGYNADAGISYEGLLNNLEIDSSYRDKVRVKFETKSGTEQLEYNLEMYSGGKSNLRVSSNLRDAINYRGNYSTLSTSD